MYRSMKATLARNTSMKGRKCSQSAAKDADHKQDFWHGKRMHPILGYNKMHRGVDFAARSGTPIYAAGNAVVDRVGWNEAMAATSVCATPRDS